MSSSYKKCIKFGNKISGVFYKNKIAKQSKTKVIQKLKQSLILVKLIQFSIIMEYPKKAVALFGVQ